MHQFLTFVLAFFNNTQTGIVLVVIEHSFLNLKAPITTKVVCVSRLLKYLRGLCGISVDQLQTAPIHDGAV